MMYRAGRIGWNCSLFSLCALLGGAVSARAATLQVPGTYATIQSALDAAAAGDTIDVDAGVYSEKLEFTRGGNAIDGPIVLRAAAGAVTRPVVDGTGVFGANLILVDTKSYVGIVGLELRNNLGVNDGSGIRVLGSGTDIELRDNVIHEIRGNHAMGITVYATDATPIRNLVIDGNEVFDCDPARSEAITLNGNVTDFEVTNNVVRDVNNIGIDFIGGETDIQPNPTLVARNGLVRGNTVTRANSIYQGGYAAGIYVDGGHDIVIENNVVSECDLGIEIGAENSGLTTDHVVVRNNLLFLNEKAGLVFGGYAVGAGRADDNVFRGNTLYRNNTVGTNAQGRYFRGNGVAEIWVQYGRDNVVAGNLVYAGDANVFVGSYDAGSSVANTFDFNLYYSDAGAAAGEFSFNGAYHAGLAAWRAATGQDADSVSGDPLLLDPDAGDFHIATSSPAFDAGDPAYTPDAGEADLDGSGRLSGGTVDIGADEATCGNAAVDAGEQCDDGNAVDGDGCDGNCTFTACGNGIATPTTGEQCDDANSAAGDCCDAACQFESAGTACNDGRVCTLVDACDGAGFCAASADPDPLCLTPIDTGGSSIKLIDNGAADKLTWKWRTGPAIVLATLGDPTATEDYTLCLYVGSGSGSSMLLEAAAPAGPSWSDLGEKGFKYRSTDLAPDGLKQLQLRPGAERKGRVKVVGHGANLGLGPLGIGPGATLSAQLRGGPATCVGAVFSAPFRKSDADRLVDKSD